MVMTRLPAPARAPQQQIPAVRGEPQGPNKSQLPVMLPFGSLLFFLELR